MADSKDPLQGAITGPPILGYDAYTEAVAPGLRDAKAKMDVGDAVNRASEASGIDRDRIIRLNMHENPRLDPGLVNQYGYAGLSQMGKAYTSDMSSKYGFEVDPTNPYHSSYVTAMEMPSDASKDTEHYLGHNMGRAGASRIARGTPTRGDVGRMAVQGVGRTLRPELSIPRGNKYSPDREAIKKMIQSGEQGQFSSDFMDLQSSRYMSRDPAKGSRRMERMADRPDVKLSEQSLARQQYSNENREILGNAMSFLADVSMGHAIGSTSKAPKEDPILKSVGDYSVKQLRNENRELLRGFYNADGKLKDAAGLSSDAILNKITGRPGVPGMIEPGNIDLFSRPSVQNEDGSASSVRSMSIGMDGKEYLIPTVVGDRVVSDDEAIQHFLKTGEHLGVFKDNKSATKYADLLHKDQERLYTKKRYSNENREIISSTFSTLADVSMGHAIGSTAATAGAVGAGLTNLATESKSPVRKDSP